jgi:hypothetical protein
MRADEADRFLRVELESSHAMLFGPDEDEAVFGVPAARGQGAGEGVFGDQVRFFNVDRG